MVDGDGARGGGGGDCLQLKENTYEQHGRSHAAAHKMDFISRWQAHHEQWIYTAKVRRKSHNGLCGRRVSPVNEQKNDSWSQASL